MWSTAKSKSTSMLFFARSIHSEQKHLKKIAIINVIIISNIYIYIRLSKCRLYLIACDITKFIKAFIDSSLASSIQYFFVLLSDWLWSLCLLFQFYFLTALRERLKHLRCCIPICAIESLASTQQKLIWNRKYFTELKPWDKHEIFMHMYLYHTDLEWFSLFHSVIFSKNTVCTEFISIGNKSMRQTSDLYNIIYMSELEKFHSFTSAL